MWHQVKNIKQYVGVVQVYTAIWTEDVSILRELFNRIREAGLAIHPSKFCLGY